MEFNGSFPSFSTSEAGWLPLSSVSFVTSCWAKFDYVDSGLLLGKQIVKVQKVIFLLP